MKSTLSFVFGILALSMLCIISCQRDNFPDPDVVAPPPPIEYINASVTGRVTNENNEPVSGAVIKADAATTTTDINGNFRFNNIRLDKNAGFIKVEKDGFFQGSRTILVNAGTTNYVSIQLIKKQVSGTVSAGNGGQVTIASGGSVSFTANSFVDATTNTPYSGTVSVSAYFINPSASNFKEIMPGALRGYDTTNKEVVLESYGMMAVELLGAGGEKLQLAHGQKATITFPVTTALQAQAPATIPLWYFSETKGLWIQDGTATRQGTNYVGTVSHFSFWNCDYPYGLVDFKAIIKDQNGNPLYPAQVELKTTSDTLSSFGYGYTDSTGFVSGKIPSGKTFQLRVVSKCNNTLYTKQIGPFTSTADIGTVVVTNSAAQVTVSGSVINCNAAAVTNGFVDIALEFNHYRGLVTNGAFSVTISRCNADPVKAVLTAYDMDNNSNGPGVNIDVSSGAVAAGQLSACGNTLAEYMNFSLNGVNSSFVPPADSLTMYKYTANQYNIWATRKNNNTSEQVYLQFTATGTGAVPVTNFNIYKNSRSYVQQSPFNVTLTEFGAIGGYIGGNLTTTLKDSTNLSATVPVNMIFRIKRTQ